MRWYTVHLTTAKLHCVAHHIHKSIFHGYVWCKSIAARLQHTLVTADLLRAIDEGHISKQLPKSQWHHVVTKLDTNHVKQLL